MKRDIPEQIYFKPRGANEPRGPEAPMPAPSIDEKPVEDRLIRTTPEYRAIGRIKTRKRSTFAKKVFVPTYTNFVPVATRRRRRAGLPTPLLEMKRFIEHKDIKTIRRMVIETMNRKENELN